MTGYDQGRYHGYLAASGSVRGIEKRLAEARRKRASPVTRYLLPHRRKYLDGFIRGLEIELERRRKDVRLRAPGGLNAADAPSDPPSQEAASTKPVLATPPGWSPFRRRSVETASKRVPPPPPGRPHNGWNLPR